MAAVLIPSLLLHFEQVPSDVQALLKRSRTCRKKGEWALAEWCAIDGQDACQHRQDHVGTAIAQLHLADVYHDVGELGEALALCEEAYRVLHGQAIRAQRHNEAVAAYAQGLLHERLLFGDDMRSVEWYRKALALFDKAREHWAFYQDRSRLGICERAIGHIKRRKKRIMKAHSGGKGKPDVLDILPQDSRKSTGQAIIVDAEHVEIEGAIYVLHSGTLPSRDIDGARYSFILPVGAESSPAFPAAQEGDYVVVRLRWRLGTDAPAAVWRPGVVWNLGEEKESWWDAGDFVISPGGRMWFHPCSSRAHVIGGSDMSLKGGPPRDPTGKIKGTIIGLLKRDE